jgi:hypothetical protein
MTKEEKRKIIEIAANEYLETPENERSLTKLGAKYKIDRRTISKFLKNNGYEVINAQNRCRIDETVFDTIDTEEKAYWLGFLYADGNINSKEYKLEINLCANDWKHLKKFQDFLKYTEDKVRISPNYGYKGTNDVCRFSVRNKHIWEALNSKGCTPRKSLTLTFPDESIFSNKKLIFDFIRGYCDGDGTLGIYPKGNSNCLRENLGFVGTESFLQSITEFLGEYTKVCPKKDNKAFKISYSDLKARKVARILYENAAVYLDRKYQIYKQFCQHEEESSLKKSSKIGEGCDANTEVSSVITKGTETP